MNANKKQTSNGVKLLGIDYGEKRVGIAVSDDSGSVAFPKTTLPNTKKIIVEVAALVAKENIQTIVVGESKDMHGKDNPIMKAARTFAKELEDISGVPVYFELEHFTSVEARKIKDTKHVDAEAAAIILNNYILRTKGS